MNEVRAVVLGSGKETFLDGINPPNVVVLRNLGILDQIFGTLVVINKVDTVSALALAGIQNIEPIFPPRTSPSWIEKATTITPVDVSIGVENIY